VLRRVTDDGVNGFKPSPITAGDQREGALMKAIVHDRFGSPDVLQFVDIDPPDMGADDVLVRVPAAALNPYDWHMLRGDPHVARLTGKVGLTRPKHRGGRGRRIRGRAGSRRERARAAARGGGARPLRGFLRRVRAAPGTDPDRDPRVECGSSLDGRLLDPIGGILRMVAVNGFVRQWLRPLPTPGRGNTCSPSPNIKAGELTAVVGRTYR
jgi:hypothetical protein